MASVPDTNALHELTREECEQLLTTVPLGRLGFVFAGQPVILPVNFVWLDGEILFRTFTGQKFGSAQAHQRVAFEVDDWDRELRSGWSVLVKGRAEPVIEWERARAADSMGHEPWTDSELAEPWVRIVPRDVTGRRVGAP